MFFFEGRAGMKALDTAIARPDFLSTPNTRAMITYIFNAEFDISSVIKSLLNVRAGNNISALIKVKVKIERYYQAIFCITSIPFKV